MGLPGRVLEPIERLSEILFGLIMALTITGAVSVATADRLAIRTMLFAALGCNLAWGIIDAGMYLMARLGERGRNALAVRTVRETVNREDAHRNVSSLSFPHFRLSFRLLSLQTPDWRCAFPMCLPLYCYFCVDFFSGVMRDSSLWQRVWLWWGSGLPW
jgi:hypothetical protein